MKKAEFLPSLYTHNAIIDAQHQELINTINKLYEAIDSGKGTDEAKNALAFLMQYTVFHFGGEEKLMQEDKYPLFTEHKAAHDAFVETVKGLYQKLMEEGATEDFGAGNHQLADCPYQRDGSENDRMEKPPFGQSDG